MNTLPATADPFATDDALAAQPIGYWSGAVHRAVVDRLRDAMAAIDVTQPQWWTLTRVAAGGGPTREEVASQLEDVADTPHDAPRAVDQLLHRGWLESDPAGRLHLTDAGRAAQGRIRTLVTDVRAQIHEGISDEEYVAALRVLRRMIANSRAAGRGDLRQVAVATLVAVRMWRHARHDRSAGGRRRGSAQAADRLRVVERDGRELSAR